MKFNLHFKNDVDRYAWENIAIGLVIFLTAVFGDLVIKLFIRPEHPIQIGAYSITMMICSILIWARAFWYLKFYGGSE
jgi:hypothetical protein